MNWISRASSNIHSFAWDDGDPTHKLHVRFKDKNGNITAHWKYKKDISYFQSLETVDSVGKFFQKEIRNSGDGIQVS